MGPRRSRPPLAFARASLDAWRRPGTLIATMAQVRLPRSPPSAPGVHYVRAPRPIHHPEVTEVAEGKTHLILRTFLFWLLRYALCGEHSVGSGQAVYWNARDPRRSLSPDLFVKLGVKDASFGAWKTWQMGGPPDLAVEIVHADEGGLGPWSDMLANYHELGVRELVRFDPAADEGGRLRVWDRVGEDLVERRIEGDCSPCLTLGLGWTVCPVAGEPVGLRLADDQSHVLETRDEAETRARAIETKARRTAEERAHTEASARAIAEARVRELEKELHPQQEAEGLLT